jgi:CBS domain-containing protein
MEHEVDDPITELKMAAAGPCMTIILAAVFFGLFMVLRDAPFAAVLFRSLVTINIGVLLFNMVPGFPLDGGRILRAAIWYKTGNIQVATRIASRIGSGFAYMLMALGFFSFLVLDSFIGGLWLVFIGFFLRQAAQSGYMMVAFREAMRNLKVGDVMRTEIITIEYSITLRQLVDNYFLKYHFGSFPVMRGGELVGIVSLKNVKEIERDRWDEMIVGEVMDTNITRWILHPSDPAEKLLQLILNKGYGRLPVMDENGNLVGIVTRKDLLDIIKLMYSLGE